MNEDEKLLMELKPRYKAFYNSGISDERERIIRIIEECPWKDAEMLVDLITEGK